MRERQPCGLATWCGSPESRACPHAGNQLPRPRRSARFTPRSVAEEDDLFGDPQKPPRTVLIGTSFSRTSGFAGVSCPGAAHSGGSLWARRWQFFGRCRRRTSKPLTGGRRHRASLSGKSPSARSSRQPQRQNEPSGAPCPADRLGNLFPAASGIFTIKIEASSAGYKSAGALISSKFIY